MDWYYAENGERKGPVDLEALRTLAREGRVKPTDHVWNSTMGERWAQASEVPILGAGGVAVDDPRIKAETERRVQQRREVEARAKAKFRMQVAAGVVAVAAAVVGIVCLALTKDARRWGIASRRPLGRLETLEAYLVKDLQMEKSEPAACAAVVPPGGRAYRYDKPKAPRGEHVTAKGGVTLVITADGVLYGVLADCPTPGPKGIAIVDRSLTHIFMADYWRGFCGRKGRAFIPTRGMAPDARAATGLATLPEGGVAAFRRGAAAGVWVEHGLEGVSSLLYIHRTDLMK